ncbi:N-acetyltransferase ESCO2-like [Anneissia japonica]|uniref:N-acetyltransferase ESCO2-like n=1 Tax=Anneissia japonica TaxID=1529436 RepID=UPI001425B9FF|nr:N-acetyltransferase ESCO2-like [Anneissia japonica]
MIGMSNPKTRKRKIVNSPLRLFDMSPKRKSARSSIDEEATKLIKPKVNKSLSPELHLGSKRKESDSASSNEELTSPFGTQSFYNKDSSCKYLSPLERKTRRDVLDSIGIKSPDQLQQEACNVSVTNQSKKHFKQKAKKHPVKKQTGGAKAKGASKLQKFFSSTNYPKEEKAEKNEKVHDEKIMKRQSPTKCGSVRHSPRKTSNQTQSSHKELQNKSAQNTPVELSPNKETSEQGTLDQSSGRNTPRKGHVFHKGTPTKGHVYHKGTPKSSKKYQVRSNGKSARKGIHMYVMDLNKGKRNQKGKAAKALEKMMKADKKKCHSQDSSVKRSLSNFEEELKIEGIEPLDSSFKPKTPKKGGNVSPRSSPRRSPRKCYLESPKKTQKIDQTQENKILETPESLSHGSQSPTNAQLISDVIPKKVPVKLFPVFTPPTSPSSGSATPVQSKASKGSPTTITPRTARKASKGSPTSNPRTPSRISSRHLIPRLKDKRGLEQMTLDAGQKQFGALKCQTCGMVYTAGHPEDEADHAQFHKKFLSFIKFPGWKNEHILEEFDDGRIIQITEKDPKYCKKKVEEVRELVDHELGFPDGGAACKPSSTTLLFISLENKVAGCLIAEEIKEGYRVIPDNTQQDHVMSAGENNIEQIADEKQKAWCCSNVSEPVVCGVSRIWATGQMRRRNIASRMVDCLRMNYIFGTTLGKEDIAFSDPTPDGKVFADLRRGHSLSKLLNMFINSCNDLKPVSDNKKYCVALYDCLSWP